MVNQNLNAWVVLAILAMLVCGILGLVVGIDHVGPDQALRVGQESTRNAVNVRATEAVLAATQTPQAVRVGQAAVEAQMTAYPVSLTATRAAEVVGAQNEQATATQNAWVRDQQVQQVAAEATRASIHLQMTANAGAFSATTTAIAAPPLSEKTGANPAAGLVLLVGGAALAGSWIVLRGLSQLSKQRTQEKLAEAHNELMKQRRLRLQIAEKYNPPDIPTSLIKKPGNGRDMARAE